MQTPTTVSLRLPPAEKAELEELCKQAGVTLSDSLRNGARVYLAALIAPRQKQGRRLSL